MPPLLLEASRPDGPEPRPKAASDALHQVSAAVAEEGVYLLIGQLEKGLEDPSRRLASANTIKYFCESSKLDFQEHVPSLITVRSFAFELLRLSAKSPLHLWTPVLRLICMLNSHNLQEKEDVVYSKVSNLLVVYQNAGLS